MSDALELKQLLPDDRRKAERAARQPGDSELLWQTWNKQPTPDNMGPLLNSVEPAIRAAVRSYGHDSPTIHSRARIMAAQAMVRYDPSRAKLNTFLMNELRGLTRFSMAERQPIGIPERIMYDARRLRNANEDFLRAQRREPTTDELADLTGLSARRVAHVLKTTRGTLSEGVTFSPEGEPRDLQMVRPSEDELAREIVYYDLDATDKLIFDYRFGAHGRERIGVAELATKMKISPSAISQRAAKISRMINEVQQANV